MKTFTANSTPKGIVSQIKRSIPDLRSVRHQPLENCSGKSHDNERNRHKFRSIFWVSVFMLLSLGVTEMSTKGNWKIVSAQKTFSISKWASDWHSSVNFISVNARIQLSGSFSSKQLDTLSPWCIVRLCLCVCCVSMISKTNSWICLNLLFRSPTNKKSTKPVRVSVAQIWFAKCFPHFSFWVKQFNFALTVTWMLFQPSTDQHHWNLVNLLIVTPTASPKGSYRRSASEEQHPRDTITLSAINQQTCSCGVKEKPKESSVKSSSPEDEVFQHAPTSYCSKASDKEWGGTFRFILKRNKNSSFLCSIIKCQLAEMSSRLDNLESSLRKDIHSILDLLHQQQQVQLQMHHQHQSQQASAGRWG